MVGPQVVDAVASQFESTEGTGMPLAERMIPRDRSRPRARRRSPLGQSPVGGDQDRGSERSGPRRRSHLARDRSRREPGARRRVEADLLHDRATTRLPDAVASRRTRRDRAEAHAARARLLAADAGDISRGAAAVRRRDTRDYGQFDEEAIAAVDTFRADRNLNYQGNPSGSSTPASSMRFAPRIWKSDA